MKLTNDETTFFADVIALTQQTVPIAEYSITVQRDPYLYKKRRFDGTVTFADGVEITFQVNYIEHTEQYQRQLANALIRAYEGEKVVGPYRDHSHSKESV